MVLVKDGVVRKGDRFKAVSTGEQYDVLEVPLFNLLVQQGSHCICACACAYVFPC